MREVRLVASVLVVALCCTAALASPTGLNNIPTADVAPLNVLVLQTWTSFDGDASWVAGLKYGPAENWEIGLDDTFSGAGSASEPALQAKYRIPLRNGVRAALGLANISSDRDRNGEFFPYAVVSAPLGEKATGHLGYSLQQDNHALFLGADAAVSAGLTLRADWIQANDGGESVSSLGFIAPIGERWLVESWASFPTAESADSFYTIKVDYVIRIE